MSARRNSQAALDIAHHLHPRTDWRAHEANGPVIVSHGDGAEIVDVSGKRYIEGMAGLWCASLGFNHPRLAKAGADQFAKLGFYHTFAHRSMDVVADLAGQLAELAPAGLDRVCFNTSGSEANETMVKLAWTYHTARGKPGKRKIISRDRGFHGSTIVAASMCGLPVMHREFGLPLPGFIHVRCPDHLREGQPGESEEAFTARLAAELEQTILAEGADTVAAFIAEPVIAGGGIVVPPKGYFEAIQPILDRYDILMLDDEIVCGFGRTGNWFGCETVGMKPDMMSVAKALSSSYFPISAVIVSDRVYQAVADYHAGEQFGHGFTNSGHPVGAAIALEALKVYDEMDLIPEVRRKGANLMAGLEGLMTNPYVGNVRGRGMMIGVELLADRASRRRFDPALKLGARVEAAAASHGLVVRSMGDILGFCPPYIVSDAQIDAMVERLGKALDDVTPALRDAAGAATPV
ncbi:MAG: aminotransferase [Rhodospirillales bacterium]|nr:aminotransferase [Rhodospirillales bacterium]